MPEKSFAASFRPQLIYSGTLKRSSRWSEDMHTHDFLEVVFARAGRGEAEVGGELFPFQKGDILIYNAGVEHREISSSDDPFECRFFAARNIRIGGLPENCLLPEGAGPVVRSGGDYRLFDMQFDQLISESSKDKNYNKEISESVLRIILLYLLRILSYGDESYQKINDSYLKGKEFIDKSFAEISSVEDVSGHLYINKYYFSHLFKEYSGVSPLRYIIDKKIELARELLRGTDLPVKEVALRCGYADPAYFNKVFKKLQGVTPLEFRASAPRE